MWQPGPDWERLPAGRGGSTEGLWRATVRGRDVVIKRLAAPLPGDPDELSDPAGPGWWRREADVAAADLVRSTPGLRGPSALDVLADGDGITLVLPRIEPEPLSGLFVARALGAFGGADLPPLPWLARGQLRARLERVAYRGGWRLLARTSVADVAEHLWSRRTALLAALDDLPQVPQHGDPVPGNMQARTGEEVLALDWSTVGTGPVGGDLGYWALSAREEFDPLLDAYLTGLPPAAATREQAATGARITVAYTVLSQAERALAAVAEGEGPLAGKFRHPAVAPHLRALQRQFPQIEQLLG